MVLADTLKIQQIQPERLLRILFIGTGSVRFHLVISGLTLCGTTGLLVRIKALMQMTAQAKRRTNTERATILNECTIAEWGYRREEDRGKEERKLSGRDGLWWASSYFRYQNRYTPE